MRLKTALLCLITVLLLAPSFVSARSGCCSGHSGVCECGCCDGTPFSSKCAPYYPQCNKAQEEPAAQVQQVFVPIINTPVPLPTKIIYPTSSPTPSPTLSPKPTTVRPTTKPSRLIPPTIKAMQPDKATKTESEGGVWAWIRRIFR